MIGVNEHTGILTLSILTSLIVAAIINWRWDDAVMIIGLFAVVFVFVHTIVIWINFVWERLRKK